MTTSNMPTPSCCGDQYGRDAPGAVVASDRPRLTKPGCEVRVLSTFEHRSFELADHGVIFQPQTDLAILNYIANYIVSNDAVNWDLRQQARQLHQDPTDIGYGLRPTIRANRRRRTPARASCPEIDFEQYKRRNCAVHRRVRIGAVRRAGRTAGKPGQAVCRS